MREEEYDESSTRRGKKKVREKKVKKKEMKKIES